MFQGTEMKRNRVGHLDFTVSVAICQMLIEEESDRWNEQLDK